MRLSVICFTILVLLLRSTAFSNDYSMVYDDVSEETYSLFDEHIHSHVPNYNHSCSKRVRKNSLNTQRDVSFYNETDTSFQIKIIFLEQFEIVYGYQMFGKCTTTGIDHIMIGFSSDIECLFTSYYEWRCLYKNIEIIDESGPSNVTEGLFSQDFKESILHTIEDTVSEVY